MKGTCRKTPKAVPPHICVHEHLHKYIQNEMLISMDMEKSESLVLLKGLKNIATSIKNSVELP